MSPEDTDRPLGVIVLAAGKGKRMESDLPKVLHSVAGRPMLAYVLETVRKLKASRVAVVVGQGAREVRKAFASYSEIRWIRQREQRGTGHAVASAEAAFRGFKGVILVLCGDVPGVRVETLRRLAMVHASSNHTVTLLTAELEDPSGYGRIVPAADGSVARIVEEGDATEEEKGIREINTGIGMYDAQFLFSFARKLRPANRQQEYYLTDLVEKARETGRPVGRFHAKDATELLGVNDRADLADAAALFYAAAADRLVAAGVTAEDPGMTFLEPSCHVERDTWIGANAAVRDGSRLGRRCRVGAGASIRRCDVGEGVSIGEGAALEDARIGDGVRIGQGTVVGRASG